MENKEFNLSEKRRKAFEPFIGMSHIAQFYRIVLSQDEEFIKLLKKEFRKGCMATPTAYEIIDKLAGDKLI